MNSENFCNANDLKLWPAASFLTTVTGGFEIDLFKIWVTCVISIWNQPCTQTSVNWD